MESAGFVDSSIADIDIRLDAPTDDFVVFFRHFAVRGSIELDSQSEEIVEKAEAAIREAIGPFRVEGRFQIPMPAFLCAGTRSA